VLQLFAVPAEADIVPERGPSGGLAFRLGVARGEEVRLRLEAGVPQVGPVRVRPVDRIAQQQDQPGVRHELPDAVVGGQIVQIERGGLAAQRARRRRFEQSLVFCPPPDVFLVRLHVAGTAFHRWTPLAQEKLRLLDPGQVEAGVREQGGVQCGGAGLGDAGDEKVGERHGFTSMRAGPQVRVSLQIK
jgi:hypothetical protein